ncbi:helix-turn-helix domain-containing protein [Gordonia sp. CPCC 205515]|uniref:PucR family transcriptional regulator n=1 Tax=Gordonia sp. CPCC 205515 TaxID=3140791 RepID=UPI003AF3F1CD
MTAAPKSTNGPDDAAIVTRDVETIAGLVAGRLDTLSAAVTDTIIRDIDFYATADVVDRAEIATTVHKNFDFVISGLSGIAEFDTSAARETGANRAQLGVPLSAIMHAYRIGFQMVWREFMSVAEENPYLCRRALLFATERMWLGQDLFINAMADAHREQTTSRVLDDAAERSALTQHLLEGRITSEASLWEIATILRLPTHGPYIAVAADTPEIGKPPLPGIETKLRGIDLYSAWRLLPDQQIGIIHTPTKKARRAALALLERTAVDGVGISAPFTELADTVKALRYARIALQSGGPGINEFDDTVLGIAAVTTPEVTADLASRVLHELFELSPEDREPLIETFRVWSEAGGNVNATAERLYVHRNTVRHRLRRIEDLTGRSTTAPREVAELCLAFEVAAHFPITTGDSDS